MPLHSCPENELRDACKRAIEDLELWLRRYIDGKLSSVFGPNYVDTVRDDGSSGVVSGEFGMTQAYERKRQKVLEWLAAPGSRVQDFASWYIEDLEHMRDQSQKRAEEDIALRKFQYGEE